MSLATITASAAVVAVLVGASAAQAGGQYQLQPVQPQRIVPMMECRMQPFSTSWGIFVFNGANVPFALPQGAQVQWTTTGGQGGVFTIGPGGLGAGEGLLVDFAPSQQSCTARVL